MNQSLTKEPVVETDRKGTLPLVFFHWRHCVLLVSPTTATKWSVDVPKSSQHQQITTLFFTQISVCRDTQLTSMYCTFMVGHESLYNNRSVNNLEEVDTPTSHSGRRAKPRKPTNPMTRQARQGRVINGSTRCGATVLDHKRQQLFLLQCGKSRHRHSELLARGDMLKVAVNLTPSRELVESWRAPSTVDVLRRPSETQSQLPTPAVNATRCWAPRVNECTAWSVHLPRSSVDASAKWRSPPQVACPACLDDSVGQYDMDREPGVQTCERNTSLRCR